MSAASSAKAASTSISKSTIRRRATCRINTSSVVIFKIDASGNIYFPDGSIKEGTISSSYAIGDVTGKNVVLVDDMVDTAGTLTKAADLMMKKGALSVRAICTHPILSGDAYTKIENSKLQRWNCY